MIKPKKSLGQNFLIDQNIIKKIISLSKNENTHVIEIGPGTGNLSDQIIKLNNPGKLSVIEKDKDLCEHLKKKFSYQNNFVIHNADVLKIDLEKLITKDTIVFGNLPYNISTQILIKFLKFKKWPPKFKRLIFMFQKEVADRIVALPNTKNYGRLSVISKWRLNVIKSFNISRNCFYPKPKVESTVIVFEPKVIKEYKIKYIETLEKITNIFFSGKRKMINKAFKKTLGDDEKFLNKINLLKSSRPNQVTEEQYYKIAEYYEKININ